MAMFLYLFIFLVSSGSVTACDRCIHQSKASYFTSTSASLSIGACGYGSLAMGLSNGYLAAGVPSLYRDGVGCGACFQIRCKDERHCNGKGTKVILADLNHQSNKTDLVVSDKAFMAMARKGMGKEILKHRIVDVEYKRIPCEYKNHNLSVRVEKSSQKPHYLAVKFLFQGGQTDINVVDVFQVNTSNWSYMRRNHGPVWDTDRLPAAPLLFRIMVTGGYDRKMFMTEKPFPVDWKIGGIYDLLNGTSTSHTQANPTLFQYNWFFSHSFTQATGQFYSHPSYSAPMQQLQTFMIDPSASESQLNLLSS